MSRLRLSVLIPIKVAPAPQLDNENSNALKTHNIPAQGWPSASAVGLPWDTGLYGFRSLKGNNEEVKHYITNQAAHHQHLSFQDEYREFLRRYEIAFDERYVWT
jgi:hypothetical protein